ncbi:transcription termination/antitermination protein NusA [Clostridia bacterium]|nr:transcription termination/antitermination protein NusA [Clostridia bacterium]GHU76848.1 transcription termination/antitermination protein NusA [Clostridia bacterium]
MPVKKKEKIEPDDGKDFIDALNQISREKGIDKELIYETIELSLLSACKKNYGASQNIRVTIDRITGKVGVFAQKQVVLKKEGSEEIALPEEIPPTPEVPYEPEEVFEEGEEAAEYVKKPRVFNHMTDITLDAARELDPKYEIGDIVEFVVTPKNFGRVAMSAAKQVVSQKFRDVERALLYEEYIAKEHKVITGIVSRKEQRKGKVYTINIGRMDAVLLPSEQTRGEELAIGARVKIYVTEVKQTPKGPQVSISRALPQLVSGLLEQEVPEVADKTIVIKSIAREAGSRTKISVASNRDGVDPIGSCVGPNGQRINIVVSELKGEKIDIIQYSDDPKAHISAALAPSKPVSVVVNEKDGSAKVVVPDSQLSLAIGKEGQNARLAAKLTGWRIDIKSESQAKQLGFLDEKKDGVDFIGGDVLAE